MDIVRGPASPIFGPAKMGGYLNFNPKSARIEETGAFLDGPTGALGLDFGSWAQRVLTAEMGGPGRLGSRDMGYYLYAEVEDSGSFYRHADMAQTLVQASFDVLPSERLELQFGGHLPELQGHRERRLEPADARVDRSRRLRDRRTRALGRRWRWPHFASGIRCGRRRLLGPHPLRAGVDARASGRFRPGRAGRGNLRHRRCGRVRLPSGTNCASPPRTSASSRRQPPATAPPAAAAPTARGWP